MLYGQVSMNVGPPSQPDGSETQAQINARNAPYSIGGNQITKLNGTEAPLFFDWVNKNSVPYDSSPQADYDMPGFWKAALRGEPGLELQKNPNDHQMHFPDRFKTDRHISFSNESQYATADAPRWINDHQLADTHTGKIVFDEKMAEARKQRMMRVVPRQVRR
jgi:hypothetical protein